MLIIEIILLLIISVILISFRNKLSYMGAGIISVCVSIPALYFIPGNVDDLYRYFLEMNYVRSYNSIHSLLVAYNKMPALAIHKGNYIYDIIQWLISKSGNYALLPFLSSLIVYLCVILPFIYVMIHSKCKFIVLMLGCIGALALFPYCAVISTVRWNIASAMFFLLVYISFNCKFNKIYTLPLYIIPLFVHQGMILPIIIAVICVLMGNICIRWHMYLCFIVFLYITFYFMANGNNEMSVKFRYYNSSTNILSFFSGNRFMILLEIFSTFVPYIYLFISMTLIHDNKTINYSLEMKMLIFLIIIDLSLLFDMTIANRYALNIGLCSILIYLRTVKYNGYIRPCIKYILFITSLMYIFTVLMFILMKQDYNFNQINFDGLFNVINID